MPSISLCRLRNFDKQKWITAFILLPHHLATILVVAIALIIRYILVNLNGHIVHDHNRVVIMYQRVSLFHNLARPLTIANFQTISSSNLREFLWNKLSCSLMNFDSSSQMSLLLFQFIFYSIIDEVLEVSHQNMGIWQIYKPIDAMASSIMVGSSTCLEHCHFHVVGQFFHLNCKQSMQPSIPGQPILVLNPSI